ncbi:BEL1-like homeodomain protein 1 [Ipomoea triloba]|uniref:BEL1-like homeodomain protein 1 n=1 Tax=Ipomoea triloba TaxID=35885 RepID=UPI00125E9027|nr:BEL1-like homeodomain protein 1 [Ipomoea triloba]XP_031126252.1 BEL1-like homeodomain protein 1 [Ipomoea triloba]XP_031126253.1 BEL1-like homeodomain protein 1 [Ipomoea triloba]XP_031126254.1 BEL1-like homeodomain protein 1 [Ipomoea triloba]XP_031126255.1 BEL1-like homeodomain protein 1 [Ipomoea triloba]XP_031126256.1 BEL1-like homeodomain protein 1 [Ipomoea triloba]XP_031126258.1 BEL1-like homeodomain protein 1 [Ipomoea triloba]XP_031126259.1 BEL1-like homeodomain protein 1 [Ipomoea tril
MATYFHGNSEIQGGGDGLQTLILMNPGYVNVGFSDTQPAAGTSFGFLNSIASGNAVTLSHAPPQSQSQQFVGIPLATAGSQEAAVHSQHDIAALHGFIRSQYSNMYGPPPPPAVELAAAREVTRAQGGLSLSLSSQHGNFRGEGDAGSQQMVTAAISPTSGDDQVRVSGGSSSSASGVSNGVNGAQSRILSSKYLKATQELLEEVVNVGKGIKTGAESAKGANSQAKSLAGDSSGEGQAGVESSSGNRTTELTTAERQEIQMKKAKLVNMLDEVEQRYRQYHQQMHFVISWFEQAAGPGSARTYTAVALQTISKQFRCLKDAILGQVRAASKSLGEDGVGMKVEGSSRLKLVDNQLRQQRALQQLGMIQHNAWRPQRGLPERSVSVLRAWLFEHFLHPYPKDSDKIMLAKQTGLTRSQVSNWFINARVRLWKPMVEEMYLEEIKEQEKSGGGAEDKTSKEEADEEGSASLQQHKSPPGSENQDRNEIDTPKQANNNNNNPSMSTASTSMNGIPMNTNHPAGFSLIGPSEMDSITQGSPKKPRGSDMLLHSAIVPSIAIDAAKPAPVKFGNDRQTREGFPLEGSTNFMAAFGSYPIEQMGRFSTEQFPSPYSTNAVSLTLGLQHSENLSAAMSAATHHNFLPNQDIQMGGRGVVIGEAANDFVGGMTTPTSAHPTSVFENFNIQNRKRFPAQLLPDFVT